MNLNKTKCQFFGINPEFRFWGFSPNMPYANCINWNLMFNSSNSESEHTRYNLPFSSSQFLGFWNVLSSSQTWLQPLQPVSECRPQPNSQIQLETCLDIRAGPQRTRVSHSDLPYPMPTTLESEKRLCPPTTLILLVILQERTHVLASTGAPSLILFLVLVLVAEAQERQDLSGK